MKVLRVSAVVAAVLASLLATGCGTQPGQARAHETEPAAAQTPAPRGGVAPTPRVTKLLVVVEENHSLTQMQKGMPYTFGLAETYGYATSYFALTHPSLGNYIAIAGGSTYGIRDDGDPGSHQLTGRSVFGQALAHGRSAAVYAQTMPRPCATENHNAYAVRHNPWTYFVHERRGCRAHDLPMRRFTEAVQAGALPRVGMVVPDLGHDAHDGTLEEADEWFRSLMSQIMAGEDWQSGRLAVVLTADEDDRTENNRVLTVVIHPSQVHAVVTRRLNHYSLTRLYGEVAQLPYLRRARTAPSMAKAFGLPVP